MILKKHILDFIQKYINKKNQYKKIEKYQCNKSDNIFRCILVCSRIKIDRIHLIKILINSETNHLSIIYKMSGKIKDNTI